MKKIIIYLLVTVLAFSLMGCNETNNEIELETSPGQDESIEVDDESTEDKNEDVQENDEQEEVIDESEKEDEEEREAKVKTDDKNPEQGNNKSEKSTQNTGEKVKGTLYFSDENAEYLNAEERELDELTAEALLEALIDGPRDDANRKTIPEGTELIDVKVEDGIAYVNFNKEFVEKHWGGSTGEMHTMYSIVNTLALEPTLNIESVQILIDGEIIDSLAGHMDITDPLEPDKELCKTK